MREKQNGQCNFCGQDLTWSEKLNSRLDPKTCYPCFQYIVQESETKYGKTGYISTVRTMYQELLAEKENNAVGQN
jgi:hypothetical protein